MSATISCPEHPHPKLRDWRLKTTANSIAILARRFIRLILSMCETGVGCKTLLGFRGDHCRIAEQGCKVGSFLLAMDWLRDAVPQVRRTAILSAKTGFQGISRTMQRIF